MVSPNLAPLRSRLKKATQNRNFERNVRGKRVDSVGLGQSSDQLVRRAGSKDHSSKVRIWMLKVFSIDNGYFFSLIFLFVVCSRII